MKLINLIRVIFRILYNKIRSYFNNKLVNIRASFKKMDHKTIDILYTFYHINNFYDYDFPFKIIFNFLNNIEKEDYYYVLLDIKVKSCDLKTIVGNKHELPFYENINSNNNYLYIKNIPVDLLEDKNNVDLSCYLSYLISNYCLSLDTNVYGTSVDLIFEYKYISYDSYKPHIKANKQEV